MHIDQSMTMINDMESFTSLFLPFNIASDYQTVILRNVVHLRLLSVKVNLSM
jgi:hypothetical protein